MPRLRRSAYELWKLSGGFVVPITGTIDVYRLGATVSGTVTVNPSATNVVVPVRAAGNLTAGDVLQKGTASSPTVTVAEVTSPTSIKVNHTSGSAMSLVNGDRLEDVTSRPTLYSESTGVNSLGGSAATADANGDAAFYTYEQFFDAIVSISGVTPKLEVDQRGGDEE